MHNGSTRLMVVPHLRTKTRAVHPSTLCVWEEKKTPIPPTCHNGNGSERAFVGRSDPHLDRTSICVSQTVPSTTGRIYIYFFNHLHSKKWCAIRHRDCNGKQHQWAANGQRMGGCVCVTLARTCRYSSDKQLLTDRKLGKWMDGWMDGWSRKFCYGTLSDARDHGSKRARPRGLRFVPNRGPAPRGPDETGYCK